MWAQIAMAAVNMVEGWSSASSKQKLAKAQYQYDKSAAANKALNNASNNMLQMADANLARFNEWRQNKQTMEKFGSDWSQNAYNSAKVIDGLNSRKFEERLANAGNLGSIAAAASAAGVGGASVEQNSQVERLRQARQSDASSNQIRDAQYADGLNRVALIDNAYNSLTTGSNFANLNYQAQDMVVDNSWASKYSLGKAAMDGVNGFSGNMNNIGINASDWTASNEKKGTTGFGSMSNMFSWFGGGSSGGKSSGGGATRL